MTSTRTTITAITGAAKRDYDMKLAGGFSIYQLPSGSIDYFPLGNVPADIGAKIIVQYRWNNQRWSRWGNPLWR